MTVSATQSGIDHINAAQLRVAAETRLLIKKTTLTLLANTTTIDLPDELIRLEALYDGTMPLQVLGIPDYLALVTGAMVTPTDETVMGFLIIGRTLHTWPSTAADKPLTAVYSYRPAPVSSEAQLELTGVAERLVERVASAYQLLDDGQPELGQQELSNFITDAQKLRRRDRSADGPRNRIAISRIRR